MGQVSSKLRRATDSYFWWCPACDEMHPLPDGWTFVNRDLEKPTFTPSFRHTWGGHTGASRPQPGTDPKYACCHYIVTDGKVAYCGDCTHAMAGQTIDMPPLPPAYQDDPDCKWSDGGDEKFAESASDDATSRS